MKNIVHFISILLLVACVNKRDMTENTAIVHLSSNPNGLHITNDISTYRAFLFEYTQKTLIRIDIKTLELVPIVAKSLPETDSTGTVFIYTLRDDVRWDDSSKLTSEDVIFSAKMVIAPLTNNPQVKGNYLGVIKEVKTDSLGRVILIAHSKHRANAEVFTEVYLMQKKFWDPNDITDEMDFADCYDPDFKPSEKLQEWFDDFNLPDKSKNLKWLCGLGAYEMTEWLDDNFITLVKKRNWWGETDLQMQNKNEPEKIIFRIIKDENALYYALRNENIDAVNRIGLSKLMKLRQHDYFNEKYLSEFKDQFAYNYIGLNLKPDGIQHQPIFSNKKVRKAFAHLIPVDDIIKVFYKGMAKRQNSYVSHLKIEYNSKLKPYPLDVDLAKKILKEDGWKDSDGDNILDKNIDGRKIQLSFKMNYMPESSPSQEIVLMIKEEAYKAGIEVIPNPMDFSLFYEKAFTHDFDAILGSWTQSALYEDPTQLFHTSQWANFGANFCGFGDATSDSLIAEVNAQLDDKKYKEKVFLLQEKIADELPYIFLYSPKARIAVHRRFDAEIYPEKPQLAVNAFRLVNQNSVKQTTPDSQ
jgi:ABC-type transport system substrate-binding protein